MQDRRVARGSTYAAMVIPAGTNPDAMVMERRQEENKRKSLKRLQVFYWQLYSLEQQHIPNKKGNLPEQGHSNSRASAWQVTHGDSNREICGAADG
jgi:hypothetical protein